MLKDVAPKARAGIVAVSRHADNPGSMSRLRRSLRVCVRKRQVIRLVGVAPSHVNKRRDKLYDRILPLEGDITLCQASHSVDCLFCCSSFGLVSCEVLLLSLFKCVANLQNELPFYIQSKSLCASAQCIHGLVMSKSPCAFRQIIHTPYVPLAPINKLTLGGWVCCKGVGGVQFIRG